MIVLGIIGLLGVELDAASVIPEIFTIIGLVPLLAALLFFVYGVIKESRTDDPQGERTLDDESS